MKNILILLIFSISLPLHAQTSEQIQLPDHKGFRMKNYQESRYGMLYVTKESDIYTVEGNQIKNPNKITQQLKKSTHRIDRTYIFADKRTPYRSIDKINAAVARSGIENVCYMMRFPPSYKSPIGYVKKLQVSIVVKDTINEEVTASKNKALRYTHMLLTSGNHKVRMIDGKEVAIESREYKEIINVSDIVTVDYMNNITYGDYIYWLDKTQRIIKKQRRKKGEKTVISELPKELMKYNKDKKHQVKVKTNDN